MAEKLPGHHGSFRINRKGALEIYDGRTRTWVSSKEFSKRRRMSKTERAKEEARRKIAKAVEKKLRLAKAPPPSAFDFELQFNLRKLRKPKGVKVWNFARKHGFLTKLFRPSKVSIVPLPGKSGWVRVQFYGGGLSRAAAISRFKMASGQIRKGFVDPDPPAWYQRGGPSLFKGPTDFARNVLWAALAIAVLLVLGRR